MSAEYFVVYYGIRRPLAADEGEAMEWDEAGLMRRAERAGLDYWWSNFYYGSDQDYLFVGREIGIFGAEDQYEKRVTDAEVLEVMRDTRERLKSLDIEEEPALYLQWAPDL